MKNNNTRAILLVLNDALVRAPRADREFANSIISLVDNSDSIIINPNNKNEFLVNGITIKANYKADQYSNQDIPTEIVVKTPNGDTGIIRKPFLIGRVLFTLKQKIDALQKQEAMKSEVLKKIMETVQYQK